MSFPDKALWIIERHSAQPLTLDGIAAACGVSRSHLAHAFGTATGLSVMQYVRERRSVDGLALVDPLELRPHATVRLDPPRILDDQTVRVVGLAERCSFDTTITIPAQWQRFMERYDAIPDKREPIPLAS